MSSRATHQFRVLCPAPAMRTEPPLTFTHTGIECPDPYGHSNRTTGQPEHPKLPTVRVAASQPPKGDLLATSGGNHQLHSPISQWTCPDELVLLSVVILLWSAWSPGTEDFPEGPVDSGKKLSCVALGMGHFIHTHQNSATNPVQNPPFIVKVWFV